METPSSSSSEDDGDSSSSAETPKCNGIEYDSETHFCQENTTIKPLCRGETYLTEYCQIPAAWFTFDDIQYWVGEGENRAMLIVQWNDGISPDAWAWGYRWSRFG